MTRIGTEELQMLFDDLLNYLTFDLANELIDLLLHDKVEVVSGKGHAVVAQLLPVLLRLFKLLDDLIFVEGYVHLDHSRRPLAFFTLALANVVVAA